MVLNNGEQIEADQESDYDRNSELKAFDDTKSGVKGLVDAGISKIPRIFLHDPQELKNSTTENPASNTSVPVIDLGNLHTDANSRHEIIKKVKYACENWGFFQVLNHGIPVTDMDDMLDGVRRFHEQDSETKKEFYSRDYMKRFYYNTNFDLYRTPAVNWRDSFASTMAPRPPNPEELPSVCRYGCRNS